MMRYLRYNAAKDVAPVRLSVSIIRCYHGRRLGIHVRHGMRCHSWMWRLCR